MYRSPMQESSATDIGLFALLISGLAGIFICERAKRPPFTSSFRWRR